MLFRLVCGSMPGNILRGVYADVFDIHILILDDIWLAICRWTIDNSIYQQDLGDFGYTDADMNPIGTFHASRFTRIACRTIGINRVHTLLLVYAQFGFLLQSMVVSFMPPVATRRWIFEFLKA